MPIASLDQYIASVKRRVRFVKTASVTALATIPFTVFDKAGNPGVGVLAGTSTSAGVVPTDDTAGFPLIAFPSGTGYISRVDFGSSVAGRLNIYDMVFKAGAYAYTAATTTLSAQPAISSRCPDYAGGSTFGVGMEIWIEVSTAFLTGNAWQVTVTYTDQAGNAGHSTVITPVFAAAALITNRMFQLTLAAGDTGVQKIESVIVANPTTAMTAGAFNVLILRPLITNARCMIAGDGDSYDLLKTGMPQVYPDSALYLVVEPDSTATGIPEATIEVASA